MPKTDTGPTLTNITKMGRQAVKFIIIGLIALMVGRTFLNAFAAFWKATHPPKPAPPTVGFGLLPPIKFPSQTDSNKPQSYILETKTGKLPQLPEKATVFFIPGFSSSLLDDEQSRNIANSLGFVFEPEILNTRTYRFNKTSPLNSNLDIDIRDKTFELKSNYLSRQDLIIGAPLPDTQAAISQVKSLLNSAGLIFDDFESPEASMEATYLKNNGNELIPAFSRSDANYIEVNFKRPPLDGLPIFTTKGEKGTVHAIVTGAFSGKDSIVEMWQHHYPTDYLQPETYPLRSVSSAWNLFKAGEGYIASDAPPQEAVIRHVYLGYYDSFTYQEYLQPIYIFAGDDNFLGYISAIDPKYLQVE